MRARFMQGYGIRQAIPNLQFKAIRSTTIIPYRRCHFAVEEIEVHRGKSAGLFELEHQRLSCQELLPSCF